MISFVPAHEDPEKYKHMAKDYIRTLHSFDQTVIWSNAAWDRSIQFSYLIENDGEVIGFFSKEELKFPGHTDALYIGEFYIAPKYRRKGFGKEAVSVIIKDWEDDILLYVLNRNMTAKSFWAAMERSFGWHRIDRADVPDERGCDKRVYRQKWKRG